MSSVQELQTNSVSLIYYHDPTIIDLGIVIRDSIESRLTQKGWNVQDLAVRVYESLGLRLGCALEYLNRIENNFGYLPSFDPNAFVHPKSIPREVQLQRLSIMLSELEFYSNCVLIEQLKNCYTDFFYPP